jgi:GGDEF domain-containing protein
LRTSSTSRTATAARTGPTAGCSGTPRLVDKTWYAVARDITDRRILEESAVRDPLTGLPNRTGLTDRLRAAVKRLGHHSGLVGVLFVDLDHFKLVNDGRGHEIGDRFLCAAAGRLLETCAPATSSPGSAATSS